MDRKALLDLARWLLHGILGSLRDSLPPYRLYQGPLCGKATSSNGKSFIRLGFDMVEVDEVTFDVLDIGEIIRVRYTRTNKAISIDRLLNGDRR